MKRKAATPISMTRQSLAFSIIVILFLWLSNGIATYVNQVDVFEKEIARDEAVYLSRELENAKNEILGIESYLENERSLSEQTLKEEIKGRVDESHQIAESLYENYKDEMDEDSLKALVKTVIGNLSYADGRGYHFIYQMDGRNILPPIGAGLEETLPWDLQGAEGEGALRKAKEIAASPEGQGFMEWVWPKPEGTGTIHEKIGYIKYFAPYDWFMGTGKYLSDVEDDLKRRALESLRNIYLNADRYVFIGNSDGTVLLAPYEIDNFYELDDTGEKPVWDVIKSIASEGRGYVDYTLPDNALGYAYAKTSYVFYLAEWDWYIGTGIDLDRLAVQNQLKRNQLSQIIYRNLAIGFVLFLATFIIAVYLFAYYTRNLRKEFNVLDDFLSRASGEYKKLDTTGFRYLEFLQLASTANGMLDEIKAQQSKLKDYSEKMKLLAHIDSLTKTLNHRAIIKETEARVKEAARYRTPLSVIMLDIDNFKQINDLYGHPFGDKVLRRIASVFKSALRETDLIGRYGGEEFLLVLPRTDADSAFQAAEKIRKAVENLQWEKEGLVVTLSGGISQLEDARYQKLINEADKKLYVAKGQGKNRMIK